MATIRISHLGGRPLFDIESHGRRGPTRRDRLSPAEIALISRTVRRVPEVMVKVTSGGGTTTARGVNAHFSYISRKGGLEIDTTWSASYTGSLDQPVNARLKQTRLEIVRGWIAVRDLLAADGNQQLADQVSKFVREMPPPRTEKQWLAAELIERARPLRPKDMPPLVR